MKYLINLLIILLYSQSLFGQTNMVVTDTIHTDLFDVVYSEKLQQPLWLRYKILCPLGESSRNGLDFRKVDSVKTSDNDDYIDNVWDKGHLAPASAFNCDRETLKKTFTYLNCVLQHQGLNRGPWKELERFEVGLSKIFNKCVSGDYSVF